MKPFARVIWSCDLYDKEKYTVGHATIIFTVVPWGALVVDSQPVYSNGMFQDGDCRLVAADEVTRENERYYRASPHQMNIGLGLVNVVNEWWSFDHRIQGRAPVITKEEDERLDALHKAGQLTGPGYQTEYKSPTARKMQEILAAKDAAMNPRPVTWQQQVVAQIQKQMQYPADAPSEGGTTHVNFWLDGNGKVTTSQIKTSSGSDALDQAALAMVQRASPFPAPPNGTAIEVNVPIRFTARKQ
jgi:TonB family protein